MKATSLFAYTLAASLLLATTACTKQSHDSSSNPQAADSSKQLLTGQWAVTNYHHGVEDKPAHLEDYIFNFASTGANSGTVTAVRGSSSSEGTWTHQAAVTYYGSSSEESFTLHFSDPSLLKVSKLWNVSTMSKTQLALVNPEVVEDEQLVFTKK